MRISHTALAAALSLAAGLSACATGAPYQPYGGSEPWAVGYSEQPLGVDRFRVIFTGNSLTSRETVERYLLYRSAELTRQSGYDWFETADRRTETTSRTIVDADPFTRPGFGFGGRYGGWRPTWRYVGAGYGGGWRAWDPYLGDPFFTNHAQVRNVEQYEATAEIVLHRGQRPAGDPRAYDAAEVLTTLADSIRRPG